MDPDKLLEAFGTKVSKSRVEHTFSTPAIKETEIRESEFLEDNELKVASTKALLLLFLYLNRQKIDIGTLRGNYKDEIPSVFNKYLQESSLEATKIPFNLQGARNLYSDLKEQLEIFGTEIEKQFEFLENELREFIGSENSKQINYNDIIAKFNYYETNGTYTPPTSVAESQVLSLSKTAEMFKFLYDNLLRYSSKSDEYKGDISDRTLSQITDPITKSKIDKIPTTFALKSAFNELNNLISSITSFLDKNFRNSFDLTSVAVSKGVSTLVFPHSVLPSSGLYNVTCILEDIPNKVDTFQVFRVLIPSTRDASRARIDEYYSSFYQNNKSVSYFELTYDDDISKGINVILNGTYSKATSKKMIISITKEA